VEAGTKRNFILQQGLQEPSPDISPAQYSALQFQPRVVGAVLLVGVVLQSAAVFLALSALLWWSALLHRWNPFDAVYNSTLGARPGAVSLRPAPAPRRFAAGMAGTFALAIGVSLLLGWRAAAYVVEAVFVAAVAALVFGGFCLGSFVFHLLRGRAAFAKRTLPWVRDV
jgi:Domain of unknown function (DUF4395)